MALREAILVELFAILLVLYGWATVYYDPLVGYPIFLHVGFYLGLIGLVYGLGGRVVSRIGRSESDR